MKTNEIKKKWCQMPRETRHYFRRLGSGGDGFSYPWEKMSKDIPHDNAKQVGLIKSNGPVTKKDALIQNNVFSLMKKF